ncbi:MAG TPA: hypothetical protein VK524_13930 [Polyangiaceae bacterium]|nr:hypothetical protein [Polyangiaceae bacterium]
MLVRSVPLKATLLFMLAVAVALAGIFLARVGSLSAPLAGVGDIGIWDYVGYYVAEHVTFAPWPRLSLVNDSALYPYGTSQVFQPWGFERDLWFALWFRLIGVGPWLAVYYLLSLAVTALGAYALLAPDYGALRAGLAGLLLAFFDFYAVLKFPGHLHICICHWTMLSVIVDFLIVDRAVSKRHVPLRLMLLRLALVPLSLAQDLAYVAGLALTSLLFSSLFSAGLYAVRRLRGAGGASGQMALWREELRRERGQVIALLAGGLLACWLYVPLVAQVALEARSFDFSKLQTGFWYASPLRLFIPYLAPFNPFSPDWATRLHDSPEGLGAGSPGWTLLLLGALGVWHGRGRLRAYAPLTALVLLCVFSLPSLPLHACLPWFAFSRAPSRFTIIYPVLFVLLALNVRFLGKSVVPRYLAGLLVGVVASLEAFTVYSLPREATHAYGKPVLEYMEYVRAQPGVAILDFPFCVTGGNGIGGASGLCPYYEDTATAFALSVLHRKKVIGQYFGRLHPSQVNPLLEDGWDRLLAPEPGSDPAGAHVQCFSEEQWRFFDQFVRAHDFAGIQLHEKLVSEPCARQFYERLGEPTARSEVPGFGVLAFIPTHARSERELHD